MFKKNLSLIAILLGTTACNSSQMAVSGHPSPADSKQINRRQEIVYKSPEVLPKKTLEDCNLNAAEGKEILRRLYNSEGVDISTYTPETDPDLIFIKQIRACPREEIVNSTLELRNSNQDDLEIKAKTSYLLIKLGHNKAENGKTLLDTYSAYRKVILERYKDPDYEKKIQNNEYPKIFGGERIMNLVSDVIAEDDDDKAILTEAFDTALKTDGGSSLVLFTAFAHEFEKSPEKFLDAIKGKPRETKETVFGRMCFDLTRKGLIKDLSGIPKSSAAYSLSREILGIVKQSADCEEAGKESQESR